ncbi:MAG: amino acid adenylation domain-containing protein [Uliginosibacterium sp.]|nr:amino acid adenylation domain-containing protein [Uliginosibacterium sp.]
MTYVAPRTMIEDVLSGIWAEVLKLERVGVHDNFFRIGGHSLLAVSLIERIRQAGLHASVQALFATPTVAALAGALRDEIDMVQVPPNTISPECSAITPDMLPLVRLQSRDIERIVAAVPGGVANVQDIYPLAPLQEGILFHYLMSSEGDPYLLRALLGFDTKARVDAYVQALQAVVDRHDILRTAVLWEGLPEPVQVVWRHARLRVEEVNLDIAGGDAVQQLAARYDPRRYRLDVREAPLLRVFIAHDAEHSRWVMLQLFHHLSIDHTTLEVVQQEIQAHLQGETAKLPAPLPFRNFVAQARLGISRAEHETYFRKLLGDVDETTAPYGLTDVQGDGAGIVAAGREVEAPLAKRLRARARALGVSAASVCHVAWAQVLARLSGREDVVFGTVLFGRMQSGSGADRVLGLFINTLPVRIRIGDETAEASVRQTHIQLAQLLRHEHAPLALAQRCSAVKAPAPLFSALLNYRHDTAAAQATGEAIQSSGGIEYLGGEERTNYPLTLSVNDLGEGFVLTAQVQAPLDPQRLCGYMHTALEQLIAALENAPVTPVRGLDVVPERERQQLLIEWNETTSDYPADELIHQLFEQQAERNPDSAALVFAGQELTYGQLNARANQLARYLSGHGVTSGMLVGVCMERGSELITSILGIFKAGAVYMPLDPGYPESRLRFMLEDSGVPLVITQAQLTLPWADYPGEVIRIDSAWSVLANEHAANLDSPQSSGCPAYLIYTSGSTGKPKGALLEHPGLCNVSREQIRLFGVGPGSRVLQFSSPNFDASLFEMVMALTTGATLVMARKEELQPGPPLSRVLREQRISHLTIPPSSLSVLEAEPLPDLKVINVAGEACHADLVARWSAGRDFYNLYGPTECTIWATASQCTADGSTPHIGRPIANTRVYVLDTHGNPQPVGVAGELCIGGVGVGRGYLNRLELTKERFRNDGFSSKPGARFYRTGDLVRYRSDGNIEFLGRIDQQVKLRGYRIELGEIEAALRQHPSVQEAVVVAREDAPGDKRLVAYVVSDGASADLWEQLREHLRASLPDYMVPSAFAALDRLPLTPNGKVDSRALPAPEYASAIYVAPRTPTEEILAGIWAEVLKLERVGVHDNFFELGGHSLLATQVVSRVRQALVIDLPLREMFAAPTIAHLGACIDALRTEPQTAPAIDELAWLATGGSGSEAGNREEIEL